MSQKPSIAACAHLDIVQGRYQKTTLQALVEGEEKQPGYIERLTHDLFTRQDGPLHQVNEPAEITRVATTAADRWDVAPSSIDQPKDLAGLVALLQHAKKSGRTLRFAGSARSLSTASQPAADGRMVATCAYGQALDVDSSTLKDGVDTASLYRAEGGRVLADVLLDLTESGRCLSDMGSGDFQTLAGALSTSTHGSGVRHGAFPALVRSLDVVTYNAAGEVVVQRVEASDGPTDPTRFAAWAAAQPTPITLVQDDDIFQSWTVSMGCLGAIYSVTLSTVPGFWLQETRTAEWWSDVQAGLAKDLNSIDYYELLLSPWPTDNAGKQDHACLVTRRVLVGEPTGGKPVNGRPVAMAIAQTRIGHLATEATTLWAMRHPLKRLAFTQKTGIHASMVPAEFAYVDRDVEVLLLRLDINATSSELAVPLDSTGGTVDPANAIAAANQIIASAAKNHAAMTAALGSKNPYEHHFEALLDAWAKYPLHASPIALRFVAPEAAFMSMQYGQACCMIEMPMPGADCYDRDLVDPPTDPSKSELLYQAYNQGRTTLFKEVEADLMASFGARPHWGQVNFLDWAKTQQVFPKAAAWKAVYDQNNALGIFDGPLTDQLGISTGGCS